MQKIIPIVLIFLGESLAIYSEVIAAKYFQNFSSTFWKMSGVMAVAGVFLIAGYMLGVKYLQNIWIVGAVSITSIIIVEPIITYAVFHEIPSRGALIGLILGFIGMISALIIK
jgi:ABC-type cobalamin transport system permease subunit